MGDGGSGCSRGACSHLRLKEDKIIGNGKRGDGLMSYAAGDTCKPHEKNIECDKLDVNWCTGTGETASNFCISITTDNQAGVFTCPGATAAWDPPQTRFGTSPWNYRMGGMICGKE